MQFLLILSENWNRGIVLEDLKLIWKELDIRHPKLGQVLKLKSCRSKQLVFTFEVRFLP